MSTIYCYIHSNVLPTPLQKLLLFAVNISTSLRWLFNKPTDKSYTKRTKHKTYIHNEPNTNPIPPHQRKYPNPNPSESPAFCHTIPPYLSLCPRKVPNWFPRSHGSKDGSSNKRVLVRPCGGHWQPGEVGQPAWNRAKASFRGKRPSMSEGIPDHGAAEELLTTMEGKWERCLIDDMDILLLVGCE